MHTKIRELQKLNYFFPFSPLSSGVFLHINCTILNGFSPVNHHKGIGKAKWQ